MPDPLVAATLLGGLAGVTVIPGGELPTGLERGGLPAGTGLRLLFPGDRGILDEPGGPPGGLGVLVPVPGRGLEEKFSRGFSGWPCGPGLLTPAMVKPSWR